MFDRPAPKAKGYVVLLLDTGTERAHSWLTYADVHIGMGALHAAKVFPTAYDAERLRVGPAEIWSLAKALEAFGSGERE